MKDKKQQITMEVDARDQKCPLPILLAKKALASMKSGDILCVHATDPSAEGDFRFFAKQTGNTILLIDHSESGKEFSVYLKRK